MPSAAILSVLLLKWQTQDCLYKTEGFWSYKWKILPAVYWCPSGQNMVAASHGYSVFIFVFFCPESLERLSLCVEIPFCYESLAVQFRLWQWHFINSPYCKYFKGKTHDSSVSITPTNNWQQEIWSWPHYSSEDLVWDQSWYVKRICILSSLSQFIIIILNFSSSVVLMISTRYLEFNILVKKNKNTSSTKG